MTNSLEVASVRVAAIIPTHDRLSDLLECLKTVCDQAGITVQPIVVNDGSPPGTVEQLRQAYPQIEIIEGDGNLWWAAALNLGIQAGLKAGYDYLLLLNDDNTLGSNAVRTLLDYAEAHTNTIVGSLVLIRGVSQVSDVGVTVGWWRAGPYLKDFRKEYRGQYKEPLPADALGGQGVLVPRAVFEKIGILNSQDFPQYFGDTDFYLRARAAGFSVIVQPASIVWNRPPNRAKAVRPANLREAFDRLVKLYSWVGSPYNIRPNLKFLVRHCPFYMLPVALTYRFASSVRYFYLKNLSG